MPSLANIYCHGVPSGLTLTGEVYPDGSDTVAETDASVVEETNRKTTYVLNAGQSGLHKILLKCGGAVVWEGWTPANLATTGNFNAVKTRWDALNSSSVVATQASMDALPEAVRDVDTSGSSDPNTLGGQGRSVMVNGVPTALDLGSIALNKIDFVLSENHGDGSWEGGGTLTADQIADEIETRELTVGALTDPAVAQIAGAVGEGVTVNNNFTISAAQARSALSGSTIGVAKGNTLRVTFTGLGNLSGFQKLWFTAKTSRNDADSTAIIMVTDAGGLLVLSGATAQHSTWGTLEITDETAGTAILTVYASATALLDPRLGLLFEVKASFGTNPDDAGSLMEGKLNIEKGITQATA